MVNRHVDVQIKEVALRMWEEEEMLHAGEEVDVKKLTSRIRRQLGVSLPSMYRWRTDYRMYGSVEKPLYALGVRGRRPILTGDDIHALKEFYDKHADTYLDEAIWYLTIHRNTTISLGALCDNLNNTGLTRKKLHIIARERNPELINEFWEVVHDHTLGTGEELIFLDEMSKNDLDTARRYGRALSGERADFVDNFVCGDRYSMVAALAVDGYIAARVVMGSFDSELFYEFVADHVVRVLQKLLSCQLSYPVYYLDSANESVAWNPEYSHT
jgi:transposase